MLKRVVFLLMIFMVSVSLVEAKDAGKSRAAFLKIGVGARAAAMGEAFCALSDDISAIYWNPAGISQLTQTEIMSTHHSYFQGINNEYFAFVHPGKNGAALGAALSMLGINGLKGYDKNDTQGSDFKADDMAMSLAYSKMIGHGAAIGAGLKLVKQGIDNKDTTNLVVDLGGLYHTPIRNLVLGATVQNIGINNSSSNKKRGKVDDQMPFRMRLGASYQLHNSTICMDVNMPNDGQRTTNLGIEYALPKVMKFDTMLRAGYRIGADTGELGFGFGILSNKCSFDYAFAQYEDMGNSHRLSTSLRFGIFKPKQRVARIESEGKKGEKNAEPLVSWINVQRFALGLFIEERSFPERLKKKKDDKKKMPMLPGINTPAETAKGTATTTEAPEVRKNIDLDKAADEIDFDGGEENPPPAPASGEQTAPTATVTATPVPTAVNTEKSQGSTTAASSPAPTAVNAEKPQGSTTAAASSPAPTAVNTEKPQESTAAASPPQTTTTGNNAAVAGTGIVPTRNEAGGDNAAKTTPATVSGGQAPVAAVNGNVEKPQTATTTAGISQTPLARGVASSDVKQGTDNEVRNAANTRFRFLDIAPID
ncbi:PorV/PorQ family protein [bacterium]|nr:PorV/PorQ family protein [bacterium]MBU1752464.1 PorV/PorQ family protein [bacterium]